MKLSEILNNHRAGTFLWSLVQQVLHKKSINLPEEERNWEIIPSSFDDATLEETPLDVRIPEDSTLEEAVWIVIQILRAGEIPVLKDVGAQDLISLTTQVLDGMGDLHYEVGRMLPEARKQFLREYLSGTIQTSWTIPADLMPLVFFALSMQETNPDVLKVVNTIAEHPGVAPTAPPEPKSVDQVVALPPEPPAFVPEEPDPKKVEVIRRDMEWQMSASNRLDEYLQSIEDKNKESLKEWQATHRKWKRNVEAIQKKNQKKLEEHEQLLTLHAANMQQFEQDQERWKKASFRHDVALRLANIYFMREVGALWEYLKESLPRAINGYPMFMSHRLMHIDDAKLLKSVITRELKRLADLEV